MNKLLLFTTCFLATFAANAKDLIILKDGSKAKGTVTAISNEELTIVTKSATLTLTPAQVAFIKPDTKNELLNNALKTVPTSPEDYAKGQIDAQKYHKRAIGNAALGFFFGPFGFLGVAIGGAKAPDIMNVKDESLLKNEDYRAGYKKKAKGKNLGNAAIGWGAWIGLVLLAASAGAQ